MDQMKGESTEELSVGNDKSLIQTQDLFNFWSEDNDNNNGTNIVIKSNDDLKTGSDEWIDAIDVQMMPKVRLNPNLLSQQPVVNVVDEWKGSPVLNYKTFRKCSQILSQTNRRNEQIVRLKKVENKYKSSAEKTQQQCDEDIDIDLDLQRTKRKIDFDFDDPESDSKRSRI